MYGPRGYVISKAVADPDRMSAEFFNAYRAAALTDQWNWGFGAFPASSDVALEKVIVMTEEVSLDTADDPPFEDPDILAYPHVSGGGPSELWYVPFNSSYLEVGDGDMALEWESPYPELVVSNFSFQYVRASLFALTGAALVVPVMPRLRMQIQYDGVVIPGTGPYSKAEGSATRGSGSQERTISAGFTTVQMLPAGEHRVTPVASLGPSVYSTRASDDGDYEYAAIEADLTDYVAIHNRRHTVIRFAKGAWMGA